MGFRLGHAGVMEPLPRFFVAREQIRDGKVVIERDDAHHLRDVLRLRPGDRISVLDGDNREYLVELQSLEAGAAEGRILAQEVRPTEPRVRLTLAQCLPKGEKMEWVLQKGTEIGYSAFIPVVSSRSVVRLESDRVDRKLERWRRVVREAAEQAGRAILPEVREPCTWSGLCALVPEFDAVLLPWEGEQALGLRAALKDGVPGKVLVVIGPEGGLSLDEVKEAVGRGARAVSLGRRILRTETAGLVAAVAVLYEAGEMG